jgi:hypothetical protein
MTRRLIPALAAVVALSAAGPAPAAAQDGPAAMRQVISINPFGVVAGVYSAEFERSLGRNTSIGLAGTLWRHSVDYAEVDGTANGDVTYLSTDGKLRYYPGEALRGFSVGALLGGTRLRGAIEACAVGSPCESESGSVWALSTGVEVDYSWALGERRNFYVVTGLGAKRLFPLEGNVDATLAYPFLRFSIGYAF